MAACLFVNVYGCRIVLKRLLDCVFLLMLCADIQIIRRMARTPLRHCQIITNTLPNHPHPTYATRRHVSNNSTDDGTDAQRTNDDGTDWDGRTEDDDDDGDVTDDGTGGQTEEDDGDDGTGRNEDVYSSEVSNTTLGPKFLRKSKSTTGGHFQTRTDISCRLSASSSHFRSFARVYSLHN